MIPTPEKLIEHLKPEDDTAQSRLARLTLSHMTNDPLISAVVFHEVNTDTRGAYVALAELILALTAGLVDSWTSRVDRDGVINFIREQLADLDREGKTDGR